MKSSAFLLAIFVTACGAREHFVYSPAAPDSALMAILDIEGEQPQLRQGTAQDALRFDLERGVSGRLFLAAYAPDRRASDGSPVNECTVVVQGDAPAFIQPDEVFVASDFDPKLRTPDWIPGELPARLTLRNQDCQLQVDPCAGIVVETIALPTEYTYNDLAGVSPDTAVVGGEVERGLYDDPIVVRVDNGITSTVAVPQSGQGYVGAILPLSEENWMGLAGYNGRLWQMNPQDGTSQLFELYEGSGLEGVDGGPVLVRTADSVFLANPVRELRIPEAEPIVQDIFVSPDVAYVSTARDIYRVQNDRLVSEPFPVVLTDRLHFGGDSDVIVGVGSLQEIVVRDLPNGSWRSESQPFEQFERFYTVTGAGGGRFVIGGSSMVAVYTDRGFCRLEYPLKEFKKLARTRSGVVYAMATGATELLRLQLPPLDR